MLLNKIFLLHKSISLQLYNNITTWICLFAITSANGVDSLYYFILIGSINFTILLFSNFGSNDYIFLKSSKIGKNALPLVQNIFVFSFFISLTLYLILLIFYYFYDFEFYSNFIFLGLNSIFLNIGIVSNYLIAIKNLNKISVIRIVILTLFILFLCIPKEPSNIYIYIVYTLNNFLIFIILFFIYLKKIQINLKYINLIIRRNFNIFLSSLIAGIRGRTFLIILNLFLNQTEISIFGLITRIIEGFNLIFLYAVRTYSFSIIKVSKYKKIIFSSLKVKTLILINLIIICLFITNDNNNYYLYNLEKSDFTQYLYLIYVAIYISFLKIQENLFKLNFININKNIILLKTSILNTIIYAISTLILTNFFGLKGTLITYILGSHLTYFINITFNKKYL